jgi:hypothetical protein
VYLDRNVVVFTFTANFCNSAKIRGTVLMIVVLYHVKYKCVFVGVRRKIMSKNMRQKFASKHVGPLFENSQVLLELMCRRVHEIRNKIVWNKHFIEHWNKRLKVYGSSIESDKEVPLTFFKALSCYFLWRTDAAQSPLKSRNSKKFRTQLKHSANLSCQVLYTLSLSKYLFLLYVLHDIQSITKFTCRV